MPIEFTANKVILSLTICRTPLTVIIQSLYSCKPTSHEPVQRNINLRYSSKYHLDCFAGGNIVIHYDIDTWEYPIMITIHGILKKTLVNNYLR